MRSFRTLIAFALPLMAASLAVPAAASVKDGVDAWEQGDYQGAVAQWRPLALAGDPDAQFNLGQAYKLGRGVPSDLDQAEAWYRRAAKQGHLQAEDNLGLVLFSAGRREEAMPYIAQSAGRGEPRAQYVLGTAHFNGDLAAENWPLAYALTKRASDAGLQIASARLAQLDQLIPLEQRQKGLSMLPEMEKAEARARLAAVNAAAPPPPQPAPSPVRTASLPASAPGTSYSPPPVIAPPAPAPASKSALSPAAEAAAVAAAEAAAAADTAVSVAAAEAPPPASAPVKSAQLPAPGTARAAPPESGSSSGPDPAPAPIKAAALAASPAKPAAAPASVPGSAASSPWRAQLGAFGVEGNARKLWASLGKKYPALAGQEPYMVKSGTLTRLQAGFANKAEADSFCARVRKDGQACLVVDK